MIGGGDGGFGWCLLLFRQWNFGIGHDDVLTERERESMSLVEEQQ